MKKIGKCKKKVNFFKENISIDKILPEENWFNKFETHWLPTEESAERELKKFIKDNINNYAEARNFPSIKGTSKLSPFIKHGQIHVETIWDECIKVKNKGINKFLTEIGWREFNHSLINNFSYMLEGNYSKNSISFLG